MRLVSSLLALKLPHFPFSELQVWFALRVSKQPLSVTAFVNGVLVEFMTVVLKGDTFEVC